MKRTSEIYAQSHQQFLEKEDKVAVYPPKSLFKSNRELQTALISSFIETFWLDIAKRQGKDMCLVAKVVIFEKTGLKFGDQEIQQELTKFKRGDNQRFNMAKMQADVEEEKRKKDLAVKLWCDVQKQKDMTLKDRSLPGYISHWT